jgi:hypothetical protein
MGSNPREVSGYVLCDVLVSRGLPMPQEPRLFFVPPSPFGLEKNHSFGGCAPPRLGVWCTHYVARGRYVKAQDRYLPLLLDYRV